MSHKNRAWFVSIENEATLTAVQDTEGFDLHTNFEQDVIIHEKIHNGEIKLKKNLARVSYEGIKLLQSNRSRMGLKFKVYMQETKDSKTIRWIADIKPKVTKDQKTSDMSVV